MALKTFAIAAALFSLGLLPIALTPVTQPEPIRTERLGIGRLFAVSPVGVAGALFSGLIYGSFWSFAAIYGRLLGMSDGQAASFVVAAVMGGAILQWPIGWLSDRFDRRYVMLAVSLASAAALTSFNWMPSTSLVILLCVAVVFGGFIFSLYGLAVAQTHDRFSANESLEATRGMLMVHGVGSAIGPVITGAMILEPGGWLHDVSVPDGPLPGRLYADPYPPRQTCPDTRQNGVCTHGPGLARGDGSGPALA